MTAGPILNPDEPDIGMCDDCGGEEYHRMRTIVTATVAGELRRVIVWLCAPCRRIRATR